MSTINIKTGGGVIRAGSGAISNRNPSWKKGDPVTLKELTERPNYYLEKISKAFNVKYDKVMNQKDPFGLTNSSRDSWRNPNNYDHDNFDATKQPEGSAKLAFIMKKGQGSMSAIVDPETADHYNKYQTHSFQLSYVTDEDPSVERISRPINYCYTAFELQKIIDEDLVSGSSGWHVSKVGALDQPRYGPFLIQAKSKGYRGNLIIREEYQTDPKFISGELIATPGDDDSYETYILKYNKTGVYELSISVEGEDFKRNVGVHIHSNCMVYDMSIGRVCTPLNIPLVTHFIPEEGSEEYEASGLFWEPSDVIVMPQDIYKQHAKKTFDVIFDDVVDVENATKPLNILDVRDGFDVEVVQEKTLCDALDFPQILWANEDNYKKEFAFHYGAPYTFWGHKYDKFSILRWNNVPEFQSFRVPLMNNRCLSTVQQVHIINCENFKYWHAHPVAMPELRFLNLSGSNVSFLNDYHTTSKLNKNLHLSVSGYSHRYMYKDVPDYARCDYWNNHLFDVSRDHIFPSKTYPAFINNYRLQHLDVSANDLNQTGIHQALYTCMMSNTVGGFFNGISQKTRNGPDNALLYTGVYEVPTLSAWCLQNESKIGTMDDGLKEHLAQQDQTVTITGRMNPYRYGETPTFEQNSQYPYTTLKDLNGEIYFLKQRLEYRGWTVLLDTTSDPWPHEPNYEFEFVEFLGSLRNNESLVLQKALDFDKYYEERQKKSFEEQGDSAATYSTDILKPQSREESEQMYKEYVLRNNIISGYLEAKGIEYNQYVDDGSSDEIQEEIEY